MAINRSTLFQRLEESPHTFTDTAYACAERQGSVSWRVYAVASDGHHLFLSFEPNKAAAGQVAGRYKRWIKEYYENV